MIHATSRAMSAVLIAAVTCGGCSSEGDGSPSGVSDSAVTDGVVDVAASDSLVADSADTAADAADTTAAACDPPVTPNTLSGQLGGGSSPRPVWVAKAVYRLERAKAPGKPQIVFLSNNIECAALKESDFDSTVTPPTAMLLLELGSAGSGTFTASSSTPPSATSSYIYTWGTHTPPNPPTPTQYAQSGSVTVTSADSAMSKGVFVADFTTNPPESARVCGRFEAAPCAVNW